MEILIEGRKSSRKSKKTYGNYITLLRLIRKKEVKKSRKIVLGKFYLDELKYILLKLVYLTIVNR